MVTLVINVYPIPIYCSSTRGILRYLFAGTQRVFYSRELFILFMIPYFNPSQSLVESLPHLELAHFYGALFLAY